MSGNDRNMVWKVFNCLSYFNFVESLVWVPFFLSVLDC